MSPPCGGRPVTVMKSKSPCQAVCPARQSVFGRAQSSQGT
ncbi:hypothetical protein NY78_0111 [Desulfovibrio sp. TomC]|nr:hypothetical protein NY78_0111 [Desulfovibrio sp. TomC]